MSDCKTRSGIQCIFGASCDQYGCYFNREELIDESRSIKCSICMKSVDYICESHPDAPLMRTITQLIKKKG
jgi:hypothetical protein